MTRKTFFSNVAAIFATIILFATTASCQKRGINGDLDGQWRIISIENLQDGTTTEPTGLFICFNLHTVNLTRGGVIFAGNMVHDGDKIALEFPYNTDNTSLNEWGIFSWQTTFEITHLTGKNLTLRSESAIIHLKKF
ncbi:MAG: lipocalin-like domain-containing protein [Paramuribaculum sp.]|nr:lipocalin-like domain-containing protein [Paramuribaculum sp.]